MRWDGLTVAQQRKFSRAAVSCSVVSFVHLVVQITPRTEAGTRTHDRSSLISLIALSIRAICSGLRCRISEVIASKNGLAGLTSGCFATIFGEFTGVSYVDEQSEEECSR